MLLSLLLLAGGLILLVPAADMFVTASARLALGLRISPVIVGAIVIGLGTSAPEVLVSILAGVRGEAELAVGNLVGSNIANLALVAAVAAMVAPLAVSSETLRREAPLSAAAVAAFAAALIVGLERPQGVVLLVAAVAATLLLLRAATGPDEVLARNVEEELGQSLGHVALRAVLGLAGTLAGAQLVIEGATGFATEVGLSEGFIGLTVVAIGTSLPELVTGIQSVRRGHPDLVVGNVLGSNIFNSLLGGGLVAVLAPARLEGPEVSAIAITAMLSAALLAWLLFATGRRLVRWEAAVLLVAYAALLPFVAE